MGTVHQLRWDLSRAPSSSEMLRRRVLRPADLLLFFGILVIAGAIAAKALGERDEQNTVRRASGTMRFRKSCTAFLSFALSQAPGQLQRHGHFIVVFAQESDPGLIDAAPDHARAERALFARNRQIEYPGQLRYW